MITGFSSSFILINPTYSVVTLAALLLLLAGIEVITLNRFPVDVSGDGQPLRMAMEMNLLTCVCVTQDLLHLTGARPLQPLGIEPWNLILVGLWF